MSAEHIYMPCSPTAACQSLLRLLLQRWPLAKADSSVSQLYLSWGERTQEVKGQRRAKKKKNTQHCQHTVCSGWVLYRGTTWLKRSRLWELSLLLWHTLPNIFDTRASRTWHWLTDESRSSRPPSHCWRFDRFIAGTTGISFCFSNTSAWGL